jgi:hypothetical protein
MKNVTCLILLLTVFTLHIQFHGSGDWLPATHLWAKCMWDLWWTKWHWESSSVFLSVSFHCGSPYSYIIWGMNNRPIGGSSSEIQSHPINMNNIIQFRDSSSKIPMSKNETTFYNENILLILFLTWVCSERPFSGSYCCHNEKRTHLIDNRTTVDTISHIASPREWRVDCICKWNNTV